MIEILSLQPQTGTGSPSSSRAAAEMAAGGSGRGPLRLATLALTACTPFSSLFFSAVEGSCPLAAPAFSGCVPPAAKGKISHLQGTLGTETEISNTLIAGPRLKPHLNSAEADGSSAFLRVKGKGDVHILAKRLWC